MLINLDNKYTLTVTPGELNLISKALRGVLSETEEEEALRLNTQLVDQRVAVVRNLSRSTEILAGNAAAAAKVAS